MQKLDLDSADIVTRENPPERMTCVLAMCAQKDPSMPEYGVVDALQLSLNTRSVVKCQLYRASIKPRSDARPEHRALMRLRLRHPPAACQSQLDSRSTAIRIQKLGQYF